MLPALLPGCALRRATRRRRRRRRLAHGGVGGGGGRGEVRGFPEKAAAMGRWHSREFRSGGGRDTWDECESEVGAGYEPAYEYTPTPGRAAPARRREAPSTARFESHGPESRGTAGWVGSSRMGWDRDLDEASLPGEHISDVASTFSPNRLPGGSFFDDSEPFREVLD